MRRRAKPRRWPAGAAPTEVIASRHWMEAQASKASRHWFSSAGPVACRHPLPLPRVGRARRLAPLCTTPEALRGGDGGQRLRRRLALREAVPPPRPVRGEGRRAGGGEEVRGLKEIQRGPARCGHLRSHAKRTTRCEGARVRTLRSHVFIHVPAVSFLMVLVRKGLTLLV